MAVVRRLQYFRCDRLAVRDRLQVGGAGLHRVWLRGRPRARRSTPARHSHSTATATGSRTLPSQYPLDASRAIAEAAPPSQARFDAKPADPSAEATPTLTWSADSAASFQCRLDAEPWHECGAGRTLPKLNDGRHVFVVRAVSALGLLGPSATHEWTVDTQAPETTIASGASGTVQSGTVEFRLAGSQDTVRYGCRLDDAPWQWCGDIARFDDLADGLHRFRAFAQDAAGNTDLIASTGSSPFVPCPTFRQSRRAGIESQARVFLLTPHSRIHSNARRRRDW